MEKQLDIRPGVVLVQDSRFFALGEDTMVLSHFANPKKGGAGLDVGTGQGFLAILTGLRRPDLRLHGLELHPEAADIAAQNALRAGLTMPVTCADLRQLPPELRDRFDFVLCNPPYFETTRGKTAAGALAQARSDAGANIYEVCAAGAKALKTGGRLYLCFPAGRLAALFSALEQASLAPKRLRFVHTRPQREAHLVMVDAVKQGGEGLTLLPPLYLRDGDNQPTQEYNEIYEVRT